MHVRVTSEFDCTPERAWTELLRTRLLAYVVRPLAVFEPLDPDPLPTLWSEGEYLVRIRAFGLFPLGTHTIRIEIPTVETTPGSQRYELRDDGSGERPRRGTTGSRSRRPTTAGRATPTPSRSVRAS